MEGAVTLVKVKVVEAVQPSESITVNVYVPSAVKLPKVRPVFGPCRVPGGDGH